MRKLARDGITQEEIRQVIYELPAAEEKRSKHGPQRTLLWGASRKGRAITVVVKDETIDGVRHFTLITAFDETETEWRKRR